MSVDEKTSHLLASAKTSPEDKVRVLKARQAYFASQAMSITAMAVPLGLIVWAKNKGKLGMKLTAGLTIPVVTASLYTDVLIWQRYQAALNEVSDRYPDD